MRPSIKIRNIIDCAILGVLLAAALYASHFFFFMGSEFGYRDLQYNQFPETRKFVDELTKTLFMLDSDMNYLNQYDNNIMQRTIQVEEVTGLDARLPEQGTGKWLTMQEFVDSFGYSLYMDDYGGIIEIVSEGEEYNDAWYTVALTGEQVAEARHFISISREDYIQLLCANARLNSQYEEENLQLTAEGEKDAGTGTMTVSNISYGYLDEDFSANSYIGYYGDNMFVYSPDEDMFYSTKYGWYTIPDTLYFLAAEVENCEPVELLLHPFASREEILRQKIGNDFMEYIRSSVELNYTERNIAYYTVLNDKVYTNVGSLDKLVNCNVYLVLEPTGSGEYTVNFHNFDNSYLDDEYATNLVNSLSALKPDNKFYIGVFTTYPYTDTFSKANQIFKKYYSYTIPSLIFAVLTAILSVIMLIHILKGTGRESRETNAVRLNFWDKLPLELMILAVGLGAYFVFAESFSSNSVIEWRMILESLIFFSISYVVLMIGLLSLVRRWKTRKLFDKCIIRWIFVLLRRVAALIAGQKNLQLRAVELFIFYWVLMVGGTVIIWIGMDSAWPVLWLGIAMIAAVNIGILALMLWQAKGEQSIRDATRALADGELNYQPAALRRLQTEQEIIDNIAHLSDGLQKAVEKNIYDERMKAELITNVSHDIKTPLTSIINYVDLIKRENIEDDTLIHYIEVLDQKSQRLKQLTEDLVEVSKITTGNLELERVPIDLGELLRQSMGEFEDKFAEQNLTLMDNITEQPYMIFADGRRTFRIFENLFQNIYKYAMPGTRVYIEINNQNSVITLSIKNVSKAPLNIAPEELMERFVRGDASRTTEGSGLGLSIAQDLVRLQDGEFQLDIDGDLFKTLITFPEFDTSVIIDTTEGAEGLTNEKHLVETVPVLEKKKK